MLVWILGTGSQNTINQYIKIFARAQPWYIFYFDAKTRAETVKIHEC